MNTYIKKNWPEIGCVLLVLALSWGVAQIDHTDESESAIDTCERKGVKVAWTQDNVGVWSLLCVGNN